MNAVNRLGHIDALRGFAALLVVWQHTAEIFVRLPGVAERGTLLADVSSSVDFGRIGIICFFLISGFVIPFSLKPDSTQPVRNFAIRRFCRLFPVYWLSVALIFLLGPLWGQSSDTGQLWANITMLQTFFGEQHMQGLYWTLQVELVFYLLCAVAFHFGILRNPKALFIICLTVFTGFVVVQGYGWSIGGFTPRYKELSYIPYLLSIMFLGSIFRHLYDQEKLERKLLTPAIIGICICFGFPLMVYLISLSGSNLVSNPFRFFAAHTLGLLLFGAGVLFLRNVPRVFLYLGTISYSLYLFHPLIMNLIRKAIAVTKYQPLTGLHLSVYMGLTCLGSVVLAGLLYKFLEKPAINLGYRFSKR